MDTVDPVLIRVDLDEDGAPEYVLLIVADYGLSASLFFYQNGNRWQAGHLNFSPTAYGGEIREKILAGEISLTEPKYRNLSIGGIELRPLAID